MVETTTQPRPSFLGAFDQFLEGLVVSITANSLLLSALKSQRSLGAKMKNNAYYVRLGNL